MATASPTPAAAGHDFLRQGLLSRQESSRYSSRPALRRHALAAKTRAPAVQPQQWKLSIGDSSDDEAPVAPMKFSAEAKALLGEDASIMDGSSPSQKEHVKNVLPVEKSDVGKRRSPPLATNQNVRDLSASPIYARSGSPRIVRLTSSTIAPSTLRRSLSAREDSNSPGARSQKDLVTPAPRPRSHQSSSPRLGSHGLHRDSAGSERLSHSASENENRGEGNTNWKENSSIQETAAQMESLSIDQSKGEDYGLQTAQRQKRGLKITGRLLSGPARRGLKRRQSDDDQSPLHETNLPAGDRSEPPVDKAITQGAATELDLQVVPKTLDHPFPSQVRFQSQANIDTGSPEARNQGLPRTSLVGSVDGKSKPSMTVSGVTSSGKRVQPIFKVPPLPALPSRFDQENEPPPTFKRNKPSGVGFSEPKDKLSVLSDDNMLAAAPVARSPQRQALAARSQNTPHRPPPPPPKMTVLDAVTSTAGAASASQARKKRNQYMSVNGRFFTRMDCIGRGGSSKVYRVMAENYKIFALKRVTLEDQDELAIRGYKGEIDLLRKLENVDRVVRLFDYEINEEKHTLSVLMEMGESDLNRVLTQRLNSEDSCLDITFTRYFWKEMLECVQAVHTQGIVHSDLKPANFLLLQGRLKLIDFGISNAIADDTVNVHREQHIGTPNYMSPEALIDSNAAAGLPASEGKMMKLGKPSDVWSLGCILYQMVYGKPPFAHIANQMQRIMAIPNPRHVISFPDTGVGGVAVPAGLMRTLRRCLNRDQTQRPTVDEMLAFGDPFLFPDVVTAKDTVPVGQDLIARLQHNIIKHVREKGLPSDAELATWPARFFASIKAAVEEGRA